MPPPKHHGTVRRLRLRSTAPECNADRCLRDLAPGQRREEEPPEPDGNEDVADARDVVQWRDRIRNDVAERAGVEKERQVQLGRQDDVERRQQVRNREPRRLERRPVDRHPAAVDDDGDPIGNNPGENCEQPRPVAVEPQADGQDAEPRRVQRQAQRVCDLDAVRDGDLRSVAQQDRCQDEHAKAKTSIEQRVEPPARQEPENEADDRGGDDHVVGRLLVSFRGRARTASNRQGSSGRGDRASRSQP